MKKTRAMRKEERRINRFRSTYVGRKVMYYPAGTDFEAPAVIKDLSFNFGAFDNQTQTWGAWDIFIEYETRNGIETGWRSLGELEPIGWTA